MVFQVNCRGQNAFGRRKKRQVFDDSESSLSSQLSAFEGQLREEVIVDSNPILALERREDRLTNPTEGKLLDVKMFYHFHTRILIYISSDINFKTYFSSTNSEGGSVCVNGGIHYLANYHRTPCSRRCCSRRIVLAVSIPPQTKVRGTASSPSGISEPIVYHTRASGRTLAGLSLVVNG